MTTVSTRCRIAAPKDRVFDAITKVERFPDVAPNVLSVRFLGDRRQGVGTRFVETREHKGKTMETELEITELVDGERVRMVTDSHGTVWDTVMTVEASGSGTDLFVEMDCRAHALLPKLLNPLLKGMFRKGLEDHLAHLKTYCED